MNEHDKNERIDDAVTEGVSTAPAPAGAPADAPADGPADGEAVGPTGAAETGEALGAETPEVGTSTETLSAGSTTSAPGATTEPFYYTGPPESLSGGWTGDADRPAAASPYEHTTSVFTEQGSPVWSASTGAPPSPAPQRGPRTGTLVLGLILLLCGVGAIAVALGMTIDVQLAFIGVLVLAALLLLLVPLLQRRKDRNAPPR